VRVESVMDRGTAGVTGAPGISETIFQKIEDCDVFVCDVSIINAATAVRDGGAPLVCYRRLARQPWRRVPRSLSPLECRRARSGVRRRTAALEHQMTRSSETIRTCVGKPEEYAQISWQQSMRGLIDWLNRECRPHFGGGELECSCQS
jgi:hypothetical protein